MTIIQVRVIDCHVVYLGNNDPQYLMLKRSPDKLYGGIWQCVTGKIENNETPIEAAVRELIEEAGLAAKNKWTIDHVNHFYEANHNRMNLIPVFGIEVESIEVKLSEEHCNYQWCSYEDALKLFTWTQQKNGLIAFHKMLTSQQEKLHFSKII